jgi:hypothetical protein
MGYDLLKPRFFTGETFTTLAVAKLGENVLRYYKRHQAGDWGDVDEAQKTHNEEALIIGGILLSKYDLETPDGKKHPIWVHTTADRSKTVILLASEYQPY